MLQNGMMCCPQGTSKSWASTAASASWSGVHYSATHCCERLTRRCEAAGGVLQECGTDLQLRCRLRKHHCPQLAESTAAAAQHAPVGHSLFHDNLQSSLVRLLSEGMRQGELGSCQHSAFKECNLAARTCRTVIGIDLERRSRGLLENIEGCLAAVEEPLRASTGRDGKRLPQHLFAAS